MIQLNNLNLVIANNEVGQGNDGDYNGGDSKKYCSEDNGKTWTEM